ncbi:MAG: hypothetical protein ACYCWK_03910 [Cuniculiplasma sp.]
MNPLYDLEVIDSAVLSGEIDDAVKLIRRKEKSLELSVNVSKNERSRGHLRVLNAILDFLEGKITIENVRKVMNENFVYDVDDRQGFIENFLYHLYYAADRYDVKFPDFNGKRCGDL